MSIEEKLNKTPDNKHHESFIVDNENNIQISDYFNSKEIEEKGITEEKFFNYHKDLRIHERVYLLQNGINAKIANQYCPLPLMDESEEIIYEIYEDTRAMCIEYFHKNNILPNDAKKIVKSYDKRVEELLYEFILEGIAAKKVKEYPKRFCEWEVKSLIDADISAEEVKFYPEELNFWEIEILYDCNVNSKTFSKKEINNLTEHIETIKHYFHEELFEKKFSIIGAGQNAAVVTIDDFVIKIGEEISYEKEILEKVYDANGHTRNVINLREELRCEKYTSEYLNYLERLDEILIQDYDVEDPEQANDELIERAKEDLMEEGYGYNLIINPLYELIENHKDEHMWIEKVEGENIEKKLQQETNLSIKETVQYAFDICNGILELRNAGIYHRDLHDRNIMIDEENDKAIIIDLGTATTNPN
ncbi:MAG: protein kinase, partial [Nanoarchaeota archaeon]|nr:protein kinase [Nanoarchaeota archaeon]